jgi:hypothetical protein
VVVSINNFNMESGTSTAKKCAISEFIKEKDVLVCVTRKGLRSLIQAATKKHQPKYLRISLKTVMHMRSVGKNM